MKFLGTLLPAAALLVSGIFALPLNERDWIEARALKAYDIDEVIKAWMSDEKTVKRLKNNCNTKGGWEKWAQSELEDEFRTEFGLTGDIREQENVYTAKNKKYADFVLPESDKYKGMIIELKCENKFGQKGIGMKGPVISDQEKRYNVKSEFKKYTFVALAMGFTPEADKALKAIGMQPIKDAKAPVEAPNVMRTYKETIQLDDLTSDMADLTDALQNLYMQKSKSAKDKPAPAKPKPGSSKPSKDKKKGKKPA